jgi:hypothetical protein
MSFDILVFTLGFILGAGVMIVLYARFDRDDRMTLNGTVEPTEPWPQPPLKKPEGTPITPRRPPKKGGPITSVKPDPSVRVTLRKGTAGKGLADDELLGAMHCNQCGVLIFCPQCEGG